MVIKVKGFSEMLKNYTMKLEMHIKFALMRRSLRRRFKDSNAQHSNIILTGPARSGKSILSRKLEAELDYVPFRMDSVGGYAKAYSDRSKRREKMNSIVKQLINDFPSGLCIEGSTILRGGNYNHIDDGTGEKFFRFVARSNNMTEQQKHDAFISRHNDINLDDSLKIANESGAKLVLIGSLEDPKIKADGMRAHRAAGKCWSSNYCTDSEVYYLALDNHLCSKRLYELSKKNNVLFIDIKSTSFERSIDFGVSRVSELLT